MARRGVIIYGIPRNHKIGEIINFANKLFAVKEYKTVKRNGRTEYHLLNCTPKVGHKTFGVQFVYEV